MARGPVHELDTGRYRAVIRNGVPMIEREDTEGAVTAIYPCVTHGRHCPCSACAQEDWTKISSPCGMHGPDCPAVYAPVSARIDFVDGEDVRR